MVKYLHSGLSIRLYVSQSVDSVALSSAIDRTMCSSDCPFLVRWQCPSLISNRQPPQHPLIRFQSVDHQLPSREPGPAGMKGGTSHQGSRKELSELPGRLANSAIGVALHQGRLRRYEVCRPVGGRCSPRWCAHTHTASLIRCCERRASYLRLLFFLSLACTIRPMREAG